MLGFVALFSLAAYLITPETAAGPAGDPLGFAFNLRYLAPALALSLGGRAARAGAARRASADRVSWSRWRSARRHRGASRLWPNAHAAGAIAIGARGARGVALLAAGRRRARSSVADRGWRSRSLVLAGAAAGYRLPAPLPARPLRYQPNVSYLAQCGRCSGRSTTPASASSARSAASSPIRCTASTTRTASSTSPQRGPHGSFTPIATCARWRHRSNADHLNTNHHTGPRPWHPTCSLLARDAAGPRPTRRRRRCSANGRWASRSSCSACSGPLDVARCPQS